MGYLNKNCYHENKEFSTDVPKPPKVYQK